MTNKERQMLMEGFAELEKAIHKYHERIYETTDDEMKTYLKDKIEGCEYTESQIVKIMLEADWKECLDAVTEGEMVVTKLLKCCEQVVMGETE